MLVQVVSESGVLEKGYFEGAGSLPTPAGHQYAPTPRKTSIGVSTMILTSKASDQFCM